LCTPNAEGTFIQSLEEFGLINITVIEEQRYLPASQLSELEKMIRLHYEIHVNIEGIDVIQHLLKKLEAAREEICRLRTKIKFYNAAGCQT
jgi:hypothetical protein